MVPKIEIFELKDWVASSKFLILLLKILNIFADY